MSYNVSLPSYSVGTDVYKLVGSICAGYGHKAVAIGGHKAMAAVKDKLCKAIIDSDIEISDFIWYGGEASYENVVLKIYHYSYTLLKLMYRMNS